VILQPSAIIFVDHLDPALFAAQQVADDLPHEVAEIFLHAAGLQGAPLDLHGTVKTQQRIVLALVREHGPVASVGLHLDAGRQCGGHLGDKSVLPLRSIDSGGRDEIDPVGVDLDGARLPLLQPGDHRHDRVPPQSGRESSGPRV